MFIRRFRGQIVFTLALFCGPAAATSVTLEIHGSPPRRYATIQEAINAAPANATVRIAPGRYEENLVVTSPLSLAGPGWDKATVGLFAARTKDELTSFTAAMVASTKAGGSAEAQGRRSYALMDSVFPPALVVRSAGNVSVTGLRFRQLPQPNAVLAMFPVSEQFLAPLNAVWVTTSVLTISDCAVVGSVRDGIVAGPGSAMKIERCLVGGVFGDGIRFVGDSTGSVMKSDVRACYHYGIAIGPRTKGVVVENCHISDTAWHGIRLDDCHAIIRSNRIYNHDRCGLYLSGATSAEVTNNVVTRCGSGIAFVYNCRDAVRGNTIADCETAISLVGGASPQIEKNLFLRNKAGVLNEPVPGQAEATEFFKANQVWQTGSGKGQLEWAADSVFTEPRLKDDVGLELADDTSTCGARGVASAASRFALQAAEKAILPPSASRSFTLWVKPDKAWTSGAAARKAPDLRARASTTSCSVSAQSYEESFVDLYGKLGRDYPCFEMKGIDWKAVGDELLPRARKLTSDDEFGRLVLELVAKLEDTHAEVSAGSIPLPLIELPSWSPGCVCLVARGGDAAVYHVEPDSAAAGAGIRPGMVVVAVNGKPAGAAIVAARDRLRKYYGYSSAQILGYDAVRAMLNVDEQGTTVVLGLRRTDGSTSQVVVAATQKVGYLPRLPVSNAAISDSSDLSWKKLDDRVGYIYVRRIRTGLEGKLDSAIRELQDVKGLIVDVRGNSGGGFDPGTALANFDLKTTDSARPKFIGPIAVLIDSRCVSAGEGWASWFAANKRATFFGERTAGASSSKIEYKLKNDLYNVRIPVKAYMGFLDRPIERRGLEPDVQVHPSAEDLSAGRDTVLEAAREFLSR